MNKEYIYLDGKVIVEDENGNKKLTDYQDNIQEILVQENLIETMENELKELSNVINTTKGNEKRYVPYIVPAAIFAILIAKPVMGALFGVDTAMTIDTIFGTMNFMTPILGVTGAIIIPGATALELLSYSHYKFNKKGRRATIAKYEYLQKQLEIEKETLKKMKKNKEKNNESNEFKNGKVDDLEKLIALKSWLTFYSNLGFDTEKYYKLYQNGELEETLKRDGYSENACNCAKEFIEEKGSVLTKRKNRQKNR